MDPSRRPTIAKVKLDRFGAITQEFRDELQDVAEQ